MKRIFIFLFVFFFVSTANVHAEKKVFINNDFDFKSVQAIFIDRPIMKPVFDRNLENYIYKEASDELDKTVVLPYDVMYAVESSSAIPVNELTEAEFQKLYKEQAKTIADIKVDIILNKHSIKFYATRYSSGKDIFETIYSYKEHDTRRLKKDTLKEQKRIIEKCFDKLNQLIKNIK